MKHHKLLKMLAYRRPAGSKTLDMFADKYIKCIPGVQKDEYGNFFVNNPKADGTPSKVMFSCHLDTVHTGEGMQKVSYDQVLGHAFVTGQESNCLGADDTVGIFLAREMIFAGVPGRYVFHLDEEIGGFGSEAHAKLIKEGEFDLCVAFDRKGYKDVITHQMIGRSCSDTFAKALCKSLGAIQPGAEYLPSTRGTFTDSANYAHIIPECTNISVGYFDQHTAKEWCDIQFADNLLKKLCSIDWENLPVERVPEEANPFYSYGGGYSLSYGSLTSIDADEVVYICKEFPWIAAELLLKKGVYETDLDFYMDELYGNDGVIGYVET